MVPGTLTSKIAKICVVPIGLWGCAFLIGCASSKTPSAEEMTASSQEQWTQKLVGASFRYDFADETFSVERWKNLFMLRAVRPEYGYTEGTLFTEVDDDCNTLAAVLAMTAVLIDPSAGSHTALTPQYVDLRLLSAIMAEQAGALMDSRQMIALGNLPTFSGQFVTECLVRGRGVWQIYGRRCLVRYELEQGIDGSTLVGFSKYPNYVNYAPLKDPYSRIYEQAFKPQIMPQMSDLAAKGMCLNVRAPLPRVWNSLMRTACQYQGILGLLSTSGTHVVLCRRVLPMPAKREYLPEYAATVVALAAMADGPERTNVYCAAIDANGSVLVFPARAEAASADFECDKSTSLPRFLASVYTCVEKILREQLAEVPRGGRKLKPGGRKPCDNIIDESELVPVRIACVSRCLVEIALQIRSDCDWGTRYDLASMPVQEMSELVPSEEMPEWSKDNRVAEPRQIGTKNLKKQMELARSLRSPDVLAARLTGFSPLVTSPGLNTVLVQISRRLTRAVKEAPKATPFSEELHGITPVVVACPDTEAFALPQGTVIIAAGLLDCVNSEQDMAAVLAHEWAHVVYQDGAEVVLGKKRPAAVKSKKREDEALAKYLAIACGHLRSNTAGLISKPLWLYQLTALDGHGEEAELRADGFAVECLKGAGYPADSLEQFLKKLENHRKARTSSLCTTNSLIDAKPGLEERISRLRSSNPPK